MNLNLSVVFTLGKGSQKLHKKTQSFFVINYFILNVF